MTRFIRWSLAALAAAGALQAQSFDMGFKLKAGLTQGSLVDDMQTNKLMGLAITGQWGLSNKAALIGELGYTAMPGSDSLRPLPANVTFATSTDRRKNSLDGFSLRGGYRAEILDYGWSWQAGLSLDRFKSRQEASGQLTTGAGTEGMSATPEKTSINVGAFAGLRTALGEDFSFEVNALSLGYKQVEWVPQSYSGQPAAATSRSRRGLALEVALGFRF
jgi:hypothetical protein